MLFDGRVSITITQLYYTQSPILWEVQVGKNYANIGSGRQGTVSAYDLARFGEADQIVRLDADKEQAEDIGFTVVPDCGLGP